MRFRRQELDIAFPPHREHSLQWAVVAVARAARGEPTGLRERSEAWRGKVASHLRIVFLVRRSSAVMGRRKRN